MGQEIPWEERERAQELYCVDGLTFDQVAAATQIAASTLKRWAADYGWQEKRREIREALAEIRSNTILLRHRLLRNCLDAGAPAALDVFAAAKMEEVALKAADAAAKGQALQAVQQSIQAAPREIRTEADAAAALEDAVGLAVNSMLSDPARISLTRVRELKSVLDLLKEMRAAAGAAKDAGQHRDRGLTAETAERIRALLGGQS